MLKMKKILLLLPFIILFSSCMSIKTNKAQDYNEKISDNLTVYIAILDGHGEKSKWCNLLNERLSEQFSLRGIKTDVTIWESPQNEWTHNFKKKDIKTKNRNGLTMLIAEKSQLTRLGGPGGTRESMFSVILTDHNLEKDVWSAEIEVPWGDLGGTKAIAKMACKRIIKSLQKDKLIEKQ